MIEALRELGEIKLLMEGKSIDDPVDILIRNPNQTGAYPKLVEIVLEKRAKKWEYLRCQVSNFQPSNLKRYLYRDGPSASTDLTPVARIVEPRKTINKKIVKWFEAYRERAKEANQSERILGWGKAIESAREGIIEDVVAKCDGLDGATAIVCELENNGLKYPGDFTDFQEVLVAFVTAKLNQIKQPNAVCAVCGLLKEIVYGQALSEIFKFYTLDKPGYIAGGFAKQQASRNAPVCFECLLKIEEGTGFVKDHLNRKLGGQPHWLIPRFYGQIDKENAEDVMGLIRNITTHDHEGRVVDAINFQALNRWQTIQSELPEALAKEDVPVSYNFFFFDKQQGKWFPNSIRLLLQDVWPTRLRAIRESGTNARLTLTDGKTVDFGFGILFDFTQDTFVKKNDKDRAFLRAVESIFRGISFERSQVFVWIMRYLREQRYRARELEGKGNKKEAKKCRQEFHFATIRALVLLKFLTIHGVLFYSDQRGGKLVTEYHERAEAYFAQNAQVYPTATHKALFLLGVLTERLLAVQREVMKNDPFWNALKDLKMKERDFIALLPRIQSKLKQYDNSLEYLASSPKRTSLAADYLQASPRPWNLSTDEMNYYFTLGLNLAFDFNKAVFPPKEKGRSTDDTEDDDASA